MGYSKNSATNLVILTLFFAVTALLICLWPLTISLRKPYDHNSTNVTLLQKDELEIALEGASMANKTVIIAVINKAYVETRRKDFPAMLDLFLEGFWAGEGTRPLVEHLLVVAMDETAHERCVFRRLNCYSLAAEGGGDRFAGEKIYMSKEFIEMMWRRTLFLLDVIKRGYSFIFTDTDILWLRNPFPQLTTNETLDLQLSTDNLDGDTAASGITLINTGFYFVRSNERTVSLFQTWYDARENSTGMKEQDVLGNLIGGGILRRLNVTFRFLDTLYFSGFCKDSRDVGQVVTVHANCCRSVGAKVADLKVVLKNWERRNAAGEFRWSPHMGCVEAWRNHTSLE